MSVAFRATDPRLMSNTATKSALLAPDAVTFFDRRPACTFGARAACA